MTRSALDDRAGAGDPGRSGIPRSGGGAALRLWCPGSGAAPPFFTIGALVHGRRHPAGRHAAGAVPCG
jgi:hypothetical protein